MFNPIGYVNIGSVDTNWKFAEFIKIWALLMEDMAREGADINKMKNGTAKREFARINQNMLNATIMATGMEIVLLGAKTMDWCPRTGEIMLHAMFHKEPGV